MLRSLVGSEMCIRDRVKIKDILNKGLSIRLFNKREQKHYWHPIFCKGQTWPTETPFKLILQASKTNQKIFEIIIGETQKERAYDVIFEKGLPKLSEIQNEEREYYLSKETFEKILIENNLLNHLNSLLKDLLNQARGKFCTVDDLNAVVLVGGGTQIPLIKEWITKKIPKIQIKSPPPIESIALGCLLYTSPSPRDS